MFFILPYELFLLSRYLNFYLDFFGHVGKRLDQKNQVNFKIHNVRTWLKTIAIYSFTNISGSQGNQAITFG